VVGGMSLSGSRASTGRRGLQLPSKGTPSHARLEPHDGATQHSSP
jgi:hypothetical protein